MVKKITVVGSFAVGMTLRTGRMPIFGETLEGSDFDMGPGGKGSNQAVATTRLGAYSSFVAIIGDDRLGQIGSDLYHQEGVNTQHVLRTHELATGVGFIIVNPSGGNAIILDMAANKLMDAAYVDTAEATIAQSDLVMAVLEIPVVAAARAMELGRKHAVTTLLNPAPATRLDDSLFPFVDYLTPNETELRILLGLVPNDPAPTLQLARQLKERGVKHVIVTMGEEGSLVINGNADAQATHVPAISVDVVDTTGAGDAFSAGLAVALTESRPLLDAVRFATCCGALACTRLGVIPSLAKREAVDALYQKHYGA